MKSLLIAVIWCASVSILNCQSLVIKSPDNNLEYSFSIDTVNGEHGALSYALTYKGKNVILGSRLGVMTVDLPQWVSGFSLAGSSRRAVDETWNPVYGERRTVRDRYNECTVDLIQNGDTTRRLEVVIRVYNEGAAFCYRFPEDLSTSVLNIKDEKTEFAFEDSAVRPGALSSSNS
jgi:hypothetical protein